MKNPAALLLYAWLYLGWFACVLLGKYGFGLVSLAVPAAGWVLYLKALAPAPASQKKVLALCAAGMAVDALAARLGLVRFAPAAGAAVLPLWLASLWLLFAPALQIFTALFARRLWLAAVLGGIFGPLSYKSGEAFGVLYFTGMDTFAFYALFWAAGLPLAIVWLRPTSAGRETS